MRPVHAGFGLGKLIQTPRIGPGVEDLVVLEEYRAKALEIKSQPAGIEGLVEDKVRRLRV